MAQDSQTSHSRANKGSNNQCLLCQRETKATGKELELPGTQDGSSKRQATYSHATQPQTMRLPMLQSTSSSLLVGRRLRRDPLMEPLAATSLLPRDVLVKSLRTSSLLRRNMLAEDLLAERLLSKDLREEPVGRDQPARDLLAASLATTTPPALHFQPTMLLR